MSGKAEAFARYGVTLHNSRWSWSGKTEDGSTVVLLLWKDHFDYKSKPPSYGDMGDKSLHLWIDRPGNRERIQMIKWAIDRCDRKFRVVIGVAKDITADPREIKEAYAAENMRMKISKFNEQTGEFIAEMSN